MNDRIYTEFQETDIHNLQHRVKEGWEIIQVYQASYVNNQHISGQLGNDPFSFYFPTPQFCTMILLGRTNQARVLFEEKKNET